MAAPAPAPAPAQIETLQDPFRYSQAQIEFACLVYATLDRGKLVVCEPPER